MTSTDVGTAYHETVTAFRKELAAEAANFHRASTELHTEAHADQAPMVTREAYLGCLMAGTYGYTLAAVLAEAARFGAEVQQHLAGVADDIITNGDDSARNADVMPAEPPKDGAS